MMDDGTIRIVAALIRDDAGRVLLVRKRGTHAFMQPGGKRDPGEDDVAALSREIADAIAANEPGFRVQASLYGIDVTGEIMPGREIDETIWIDPASPPKIPLAPLTRDHVLPLASTRGVAGNAR
jgi:8-oxo-dGTP diphosphatase